MMRAVPALVVVLLSDCSAAVGGAAHPDGDTALVTTSLPPGSPPLAVEPGDLEPLALTATEVRTMVGTHLVTAYSFERSGENYGCAHHSAATANVVVEMLNCTNKDVVRDETRRLVNAILARVPG